ncbi:MAG: DoxX family protein [Bacteroidetes bacterium]|nr:DoxX family protein [Bacteroidota bacterium]MBS1541565.1 DoxX family protein [Bacteroidota bacterium]
MKAYHIMGWAARIIAAVILSQTLYFKFTAAEESVKLFSALGAEPWGRIGVGVIELIAAVLLLIPATVWLGSVLSIGLMLGAIASHLLVIGVWRDDGGQLFYYALIVLACALYSFWQSRQQIPAVIKKILPQLLQ